MMQEQEKRTEDQELWEAVFRTKAYKRESERFLPEVVEIQAVVGACGFSGGKAGIFHLLRCPSLRLRFPGTLR